MNVIKTFVFVIYVDSQTTMHLRTHDLNRFNELNMKENRLTVTENFIRVVSTVVLPVAPGAMCHTASVHTPSVALLTHTVG